MREIPVSPAPSRASGSCHESVPSVGQVRFPGFQLIRFIRSAIVDRAPWQALEWAGVSRSAFKNWDRSLNAACEAAMNERPSPAIGPISVRYVLALSLLALLAVANYWLLSDGVESTALRLNTLDAGARQQRLLDQIADLARHLTAAEADAQSELRSGLQAAARQLELVHDSLMNGNERLGLPAERSPELSKLYFDETAGLDSKLRQVIAAAKALAAAPADQLTVQNSDYQVIVAAETDGNLIGLMENVNDIYQRENEDHLQRLANLQRWALGSMLIVILLTALFVFRPLARRIEQEVDNLTALNATLEKRIAERTAATDERAAQLAKSESALREQTRILRSILESMADGVIVADEQGNFLLFNSSAEQILGIGPGATSPDQWTSYFGLYLPDKVTPYPPEDLPLRRAMRGETVERAEVFVRPGKGPAGLWLATSSRPLRDDEGRLRGGVAVFQDITRRKRAEEALRDSEALYQSLVDSLPLNFFRKDLDGAVTFANQRYCQTLGRALDDLLGKTDFDLFPVELAEKYLSDDHRVVDSGTPFECVEEHRKPNGELMYVQVFKAPVYDAEGKCIGIQGIFWDVTDRQTAELRVRRTALELARSNEELQRFALVASQDLQEPLHRVQASSAALRARCAAALDEQGRDELARLQEDAGHMQRLLDDLLSLARISTQGQSFAPLDLAQLAHEVVADMQHRLDQQGGRVEVGDLPTVEADRDQMRQLLENLLDNALRFRRHDVPLVVRIQGRICRLPTRDDRATEAETICQLEIEDNGRGIDEQHLDRIFHLFQRLPNEDHEGTGLGLALCRRIAERHGGAISARSVAGVGSTFIVTLAVRHTPETAAA